MVYFGEFEGRFAIFISIIVIFLDKLSHNRGSGLLINRLIRYSHGIKRILSLICNFLLSYHQEKPEELKSNNRREWFSGKIPSCHLGAPGSTPGSRILFFFNLTLNTEFRY